MKRWFILMLLATLFMAGVGFLSYFSTVLSKTVAKTDIHRKVTECQEMAEKKEREIHKPFTPSSVFAVPFKYHYNAKFSRCFYLGGETYGEGEEAVRYLKIIDVSTNRILHTYSEHLSPHSETKYDKKNKKIKEKFFEEGAGSGQPLK